MRQAASFLPLFNSLHLWLGSPAAQAVCLPGSWDRAVSPEPALLFPREVLDEPEHWVCFLFY